MRPDQLQWGPAPSTLPKGAQFAVLAGDPGKAGPFTIRLKASAYLNDLFRQGAFKGGTPREAYFVKCDHDTTTDEDIANGVVNVLVGIAPVRPAEFVIVRIQQTSGQFEL